MLTTAQAAVLHSCIELGDRATRGSVAFMAPNFLRDDRFDSVVAQVVLDDLILFKCISCDADTKSLTVTPRARRLLKEFGQQLQPLVSACQCR